MYNYINKYLIGVDTGGVFSGKGARSMSKIYFESLPPWIFNYFKFRSFMGWEKEDKWLANFFKGIPTGFLLGVWYFPPPPHKLKLIEKILVSLQSFLKYVSRGKNVKTTFIYLSNQLFQISQRLAPLLFRQRSAVR